MTLADRIEIMQGDITDENVDAIVNAANTNLILGAGVAGAIRKKGGPSIQEECNLQSPVELGEAALTGGGNLPTKKVIHAAVMNLGQAPTKKSIHAATLSSLKLAAEHEVETISFPALGTGVGGFSMEHAARIMLSATRDFLAGHLHPLKVRFVLFDDSARDIFMNVWEELK